MGRCDTKRSDTLGFVSGLRLGPERFQHGLCGFCPVFRIIVGGDYYIELIESCNCNSKEEVLQRQNYYICAMDCLNKQALFINPAPPVVRGYGF